MRWRVIVVSSLACLMLALIISLRVNPVERNNAGNSFYQQQTYDSALRAYQVAQVNAPEQAEYYYNAASALIEVGRLRDALLALEQATKTADENLITQAYYNLGNIYFELARYGEAVEVYREVLSRTPDDENARYNYELALLRYALPSPTPQEQQTLPEEDEIDPDVTPTSNPAAQDGPTPTPPPDSEADPEATPQEGFSGDLDSPLTASLTPLPGGSLSVEEVEQRLDAIQDTQQTMREILIGAATPSRLNAKDW
jgi:Ca-activated chloride channel family protein